MDKLIDQLNKMPLAARVGSIAGVVALLTAGNFFVMISDLEAKIEAAAGEQDKLDRTLSEKKNIADNLQERRKELDSLNARLQDALNELPEEKNLEELLAQLNDLGRKSGLEIGSITPGAESPADFFSRIPIKMQVSGNFHEIALFLQEVSNMRRIVNVNNIKLGGGKLASDKMILSSDFLATTFRFISPTEPKKGVKK